MTRLLFPSQDRTEVLRIVTDGRTLIQHRSGRTGRIQLVEYCLAFLLERVLFAGIKALAARVFFVRRDGCRKADCEHRDRGRQLPWPV